MSGAGVIPSGAARRPGRPVAMRGWAAAVALGLHALPLAGLLLKPAARPALVVETPAMVVELVRPQAPPAPPSERPPGPLQVEAAVARVTPRVIERVRLRPIPDDVEPVTVVERPPQPAVSVQAVPAPATTAPIARPAPPAAAATSAPASWQARLLAHLEQHKRFPASAQSRRLQGVTQLRFTMDRQGRVLSSKVERSSGHGALDRAALEMLQRAQPLPEPPSNLTGASLELVVPVDFFFRR